MSVELTATDCANLARALDELTRISTETGVLFSGFGSNYLEVGGQSLGFWYTKEQGYFVRDLT
jgi:hypothetical protein